MRGVAQTLSRAFSFYNNARSTSRRRSDKRLIGPRRRTNVLLQGRAPRKRNALHYNPSTEFQQGDGKYRIEKGDSKNTENEREYQNKNERRSANPNNQRATIREPEPPTRANPQTKTTNEREFSTARASIVHSTPVADVHMSMFRASMIVPNETDVGVIQFADEFPVEFGDGVNMDGLIDANDAVDQF